MIVRSITSVGGQCPAGAAQSYSVSPPMRVEFVALVLFSTGALAVATNRNNNCKTFFHQLIIDGTRIGAPNGAQHGDFVHVTMQRT